MQNPMRELPPSERGEAKAADAARLKKLAEQKTAMLREDFGRTFQTEHGKRVLAWMFERSGYGKSKVALATDGGVNKDMTVFLAQEETFYIEIRKHVPVAVLAQVEYGAVKPSGIITEAKKKK